MTWIARRCKLTVWRRINGNQRWIFTSKASGFGIKCKSGITSTAACVSLQVSIGLCVIWIGAAQARVAAASLPRASPENTNRLAAHPTAALHRWLAVISSFRRECHEKCRTSSVLQLPADYISRISILKGRLLEHRDNDWVLKIISPLIIDDRHWDLGKRNCR